MKHPAVCHVNVFLLSKPNQRGSKQGDANDLKQNPSCWGKVATFQPHFLLLLVFILLHPTTGCDVLGSSSSHPAVCVNQSVDLGCYRGPKREVFICYNSPAGFRLQAVWYFSRWCKGGAFCCWTQLLARCVGYHTGTMRCYTSFQ